MRVYFNAVFNLLLSTLALSSYNCFLSNSFLVWHWAHYCLPRVYLTAVIHSRSYFIYCHPFHEDELMSITPHLINPSFWELTPLLSLGSLVNLINADFISIKMINKHTGSPGPSGTLCMTPPYPVRMQQ